MSAATKEVKKLSTDSNPRVKLYKIKIGRGLRASESGGYYLSKQDFLLWNKGYEGLLLQRILLKWVYQDTLSQE